MTIIQTLEKCFYAHRRDILTGKMEELNVVMVLDKIADELGEIKYQLSRIADTEEMVGI